MKVFGNAPLPKLFEKEAVFSPDGREFALPADTSRLFIQWCLESNLNVTGYDVWLGEPIDNTLLDDCSVRGGAGECLRAIESSLNNSEILKYNRKVFFNIWVDSI